MSDYEQIVVRDALPQERASIHDLTMHAYEEYADRMRPGAWQALRDVLEATLASDIPAERIVAVRGNRIVGSVMLYAPDIQSYGDAHAGAGAPEIRLLAVAPDMRRHGIGERLTHECIRRARARGAHDIGLHSSESLESAIRMYERLGFERVPEQDFRVADSELVMGYRLAL